MGGVSLPSTLLRRSLPGDILVLVAFLERIDRVVSRLSNAEFVFDKVQRLRGGNLVVGVLSSGLVQGVLLILALFWFVWVVSQESQASSDKILARLKLWGRTRVLLTIGTVLAVAVTYELAYGRYVTIESAAPQMVAWGTEPYHAVIDATKVNPKFKERYGLILVTRGQDNTVDIDADTAIDKSQFPQSPTTG